MGKAAYKARRRKIRRSGSRRDSAFDQALERVFRKYGNDLSAFYRDVQRKLKAT